MCKYSSPVYEIREQSLIAKVGNTPKDEAGEENQVGSENVEVPESEPPLENPLAVPFFAESVKAVDRPEVFQEVRDDPRHGEKVPKVDVSLLRQGHQDDDVEENLAEFPVQEAVDGDLHLKPQPIQQGAP